MRALASDQAERIGNALGNTHVAIRSALENGLLMTKKEANSSRPSSKNSRNESPEPKKMRISKSPKSRSKPGSPKQATIS